MNIAPDPLLSIPLLSLLAAAAWHDARSFRIPNSIIVSGLVLGIALNSYLPAGLGFSAAALGLLAGLFGLLPLYLLRIWGAGDVKLMAVVGAFLGPAGLLGALLISFLMGGLAAFLVAMQRGSVGLLLQNLRYMLYQLIFSAQVRGGHALVAPAKSAGTSPAC